MFSASRFVSKSHQTPTSQVDLGFQTKRTEEYVNPLFEIGQNKIRELFQQIQVENKEFVYNGLRGLYTGQWKEGRPHGNGKIEFENCSYDGQWDYGTPHGQGTMHFKKGPYRDYKGQLEDGKPQGIGTLSFTDGRVYDGQWKKGVFCKGTMIYADRRVYEGPLEDEKPQGIGTMKYDNGAQYKGMFKGGLRDGEGTMLYLNGVQVKGNWENDQLVGNRTSTYFDGTKFVGNHRYGEHTLPDGEGTK